MTVSIKAQAVSLLLALALGAALGLFYDLLRLPRRAGGKGGAIWDLLFCLGMGVTAFLYAMGAGNGRLGLWDLAFLLLGFVLYWQLPGSFFRKITGPGHRISDQGKQRRKKD